MAFTPYSSKGKYKFTSKSTKNPNLRYLGAVAVAIVLIIVAAVVVLNMTPKKPDSPLNINLSNISQPANVSNEFCDDFCWLAKGTEQKSTYACDQIYNESVAQECYEKVSPYSLEACLNVKDAIIKRDCTIANAASSKSIYVCNNLAEEADKKSCILKIDSCYYKTDGEKNLCMALSQSDYTKCGSDETCFLSFLDSFKNESSCDFYNSQEFKTACLSLLRANDFCGQLPYKDQQDKCRNKYSSLSNKSYICEQITLTSSYALECRTNFAISSTNISLCQQLDTQSRMTCDLAYSKATGDAAGCKDVPDYALNSLGKCYYEAAIANGNPSLCAGLVGASGWSLSNCYSISIFQNTTALPPENCDGIVHPEWKDKCYYESAVKNNNSALCSLVVSYSDRNNCLAKFQ